MTDADPLANNVADETETNPLSRLFVCASVAFFIFALGFSLHHHVLFFESMARAIFGRG